MISIVLHRHRCITIQCDGRMMLHNNSAHSNVKLSRPLLEGSSLFGGASCITCPTRAVPVLWALISW